MDISTYIETKTQRDAAIVLEIGTENIQDLPHLFTTVNENFGGEWHDKYFIQARKDGRLDVSDSSFDYCFTENALYFWEEPISHLKEIYRVLKSGGMLRMAFIEKKYGGDLPWTQLDFTFYNPDEVKFFFIQAGFVDIKIKQMSIENKGVNGKMVKRPFTLISGYK
jgi:SAM-dependent methyltransferase